MMHSHQCTRKRELWTPTLWTPTLWTPTRSNALRTAQMIVAISNIRQQNGYYELIAEISNGELDTYGTHMDLETTLKNFVEDAKRGVVVGDSHKTSNTGYGRTYDAELKDGKVLAKIRIPDSGEFEGMTHRTPESLMNFIRKEQISDVSVGFYDEELECDDCSEMMTGYGYCRSCHYYLNDRIKLMIDGKEIVKRMTAKVVNARLGEVSFVGTSSNSSTKIISFDKKNKDEMRSQLTTDLQSGVINQSYYDTVRSRFALDDSEPEPESTPPSPEPESEPEPEPQPQPQPTLLERHNMDKELKAEQKRSADLQQEVDDLTEINEEHEETIKTRDATISERDARITELEAAEKELAEEETRVRALCLDVYKEHGKLISKERSEDDIKTYQEKVDPMRLSQLRAELKDQMEQRDIYKTLNAGEGGEEGGGDPAQGGKAKPEGGSPEPSPSNPESPETENKDEYELNLRAASLSNLGL